MIDSSSKTPVIGWFISGHGLGHASRSTQVIRRLPASQVRVIVFSLADRHFIERECGRPVRVISRSWDHGPVQASGFEIDWEASFRECLRVQESVENDGGALGRFLMSEGATLVVSDISPYPLAVASRLGIPGVCITNFTWCDVLAPCTVGDKRREDLITAYRADYECASLTLRTPLSFPMNYMPHRQDIDLIATCGVRNRRAELRQSVGARDDERLVCLYLGLWGTGDLDTERLRSIRGVRFVSYRPVGDCASIVDPDLWPFEDLITSCDCVMCKPGYGAFSSCMANGVPCLTYPRPEFAEYHYLRSGVDAWGGAVHLPVSDMMSGNWLTGLEETLSLRPERVSSDGALQGAHYILDLLGVS